MQMITCPNCGKPVSGTARSCGYCGQSLVQEYFSQKTKAKESYPTLGAGSAAATVLGAFGAVAILAALVFQVLTLFGIGTDRAPDISMLWWIRTMTMTLLPVIFLVQQLALHGLRFSLFFDAGWLFLSACGLGFTIQGYLDRGAKAFYDVSAIAYLLTLGCGLCVISCITGIISYRSPK